MAEDYTFFKDCYNYIEDEKYALNEELSIFYSNNCTNLNDWEQDYTDICVNFKKVIIYINNKFNTSHFYHNSTFIPYMNFWLNYQLAQLKYSKFTAESFYKLIEEHDPIFFTSTFKINAHNISENDLKYMKSLYDLYKLYNDIITLDPGNANGCNSKENECFILYKDLIQNCTPGVEKKICKALLDFRALYNTLKRASQCLNKELPELPSYNQVIIPSQKLDTVSELKQEQVQAENRETISSVPTELPQEKNKMIGFAGSILGSSTVLFSIYLFTPLGSWFRRKIQRKNANVGDLKEESHKLLDITERQYQNYDKIKYGISYESFADS
ncbi:VIR protein [Plasmodium vivax]|uniref:VIR protein n=1 Tax=Plasmodium vivax TaxID=5855 RepID=A0A1G4E4D5_PLAVI|nr:VIR protein [Plasmodium vivax]